MISRGSAPGQGGGERPWIFQITVRSFTPDSEYSPDIPVLIACANGAEFELEAALLNIGHSAVVFRTDDVRGYRNVVSIRRFHVGLEAEAVNMSAGLKVFCSRGVAFEQLHQEEVSVKLTTAVSTAAYTKRKAFKSVKKVARSDVLA